MQISNLKIVSGKLSNEWQIILSWTNPTSTYEEVRVVYKSVPGTDPASFPANETDGSFVALTGDEDHWLHSPQGGLVANTRYCYSVFVKAGGLWDVAVTGEKVPEDQFAFAGALVAKVFDDNDTALLNHTVKITRVRDNLVFPAPPSTAPAFPVTTDLGAPTGIAAFYDSIPTSSSSDTVLWLGDEVVITVEFPAGTTVYERTMTIDYSMIDVGFYNLVVTPEVAPANLLPAKPTITMGDNPSTTSDVTPEFIWNHSVDPDTTPNDGKVDYAIEMDTSVAFNTADYRIYKTVEADYAHFRYTLNPGVGEVWNNFPSGGLSAPAGAKIKFIVPTPLRETSWKWRVYATDRTLA